MNKLRDLSYSDVKAIYDFLEIRKEIVLKYSEYFGELDVLDVLEMQKAVGQELNERFNSIHE